MYLKDLISALTELYDSYTVDYKDLAGEPEITIDLYEKQDTKSILNTYDFKGITPNISVRRTYDGSFLVLTATPVKKKARKQRVIKGRKQ
jgi:hypothetical protein